MTDPVSAVQGTRALMVEMQPHQPLAAQLYPVTPPAAERPNPVGQAVASLQSTSERLLDGQADGPGRLMAQAERALLKASTPNDHLAAVLIATDVSVQVSTQMMKFHLSTSLGSAVTSVFNGLLRNRE